MKHLKQSLAHSKCYIGVSYCYSKVSDTHVETEKYDDSLDSRACLTPNPILLAHTLQ